MADQSTAESILQQIKDMPAQSLRPHRANRRDPEFARLYRAARRHFGQWRDALRAAGHDPDTILDRTQHTRVSFIKALKEIPLKERNSKAMQKHPERNKLFKAGLRLFPRGGWDAALRAARSDPKEVRQRKKPCSTEEILAYIHQRKEARLSLAPAEVLKDKEGRRCYDSAIRNWRETWMSSHTGWLGAVEEAGYNLEEEGIRLDLSIPRS